VSECTSECHHFVDAESCACAAEYAALEQDAAKWRLVEDAAAKVSKHGGDTSLHTVFIGGTSVSLVPCPNEADAAKWRAHAATDDVIVPLDTLVEYQANDRRWRAIKAALAENAVLVIQDNHPQLGGHLIAVYLTCDDEESGHERFMVSGRSPDAAADALAQRQEGGR